MPTQRYSLVHHYVLVYCEWRFKILPRNNWDWYIKIQILSQDRNIEGEEIDGIMEIRSVSMFEIENHIYVLQITVILKPTARFYMQWPFLTVDLQQLQSVSRVFSYNYTIDWTISANFFLHDT